MPFYLIDNRSRYAEAIVQAPSFAEAVKILGWDISECTMNGVTEDRDKAIDLMKSIYHTGDSNVH